MKRISRYITMRRNSRANEYLTSSVLTYVFRYFLPIKENMKALHNTIIILGITKEPELDVDISYSIALNKEYRRKRHFVS